MKRGKRKLEKKMKKRKRISEKLKIQVKDKGRNQELKKDKTKLKLQGVRQLLKHQLSTEAHQIRERRKEKK